MTDREKHIVWRRRLMKIGMIAGALLAIACRSVPPEYEDICRAVAQVAPVVCGGVPQ